MWMPAHLSSAQSLPAQLNRNRYRLADGRALTRHMVWANAFVDGHAKIAANTFRPLQSDIALVRDEAARVEGIARWIGLATAWANHHPAPGTLPTRTRAVYLRDSEAARPRGRRAAGAKRQVPEGGLVAHTIVEEVAPDEPTASEAQLDGASLQVSPLPAGDWLTVRRNAAAAQDRAAGRAHQDGDSLRLQDWLESRPATTCPKVSASQRLQALRDRLGGRRRPCGCPVLSPPCECAAANLPSAVKANVEASEC